MRLYYDMPDFRYRLHREIIDETYPTLSQRQLEHEAEPAAAVEVEQIPAVQPVRDPLAPAYKVGDTVYLKNMPFEIVHINYRDVEVRNLTLEYPVSTFIEKGQFEWQLSQDPRNNHIAEFLAADTTHYNTEYRESLISHFLTGQTRADLSDWLRSGEGNTSIAQRLADRFSGQNGTIQLTSGNIATYSTDTNGIKVTTPLYAGLHTWRDAFHCARVFL